jgi:hypothetical protein
LVSAWAGTVFKAKNATTTEATNFFTISPLFDI